MVRHLVTKPASTDAASPRATSGGARVLRQGVALPANPLLRAVLLPFALVFAALGGVLFVILLPVCGIATIAEAIAKGAWSFVRGAMPRTVSQSATHH